MSLSNLDEIITGLEIFLESFLCGSEGKFQQLGLRGIKIFVVLYLGWAIHNIKVITYFALILGKWVIYNQFATW